MKTPAVRGLNLLKRFAPDSSLGHSMPEPKKPEETSTFHLNEDDGPYDYWKGHEQAERIFDDWNS